MMGRYIIQYQRWQRERWYDDPGASFDDDVRAKEVLQLLRETQEGSQEGCGVRYRLILREINETVIDEATR